MQCGQWRVGRAQSTAGELLGLRLSPARCTHLLLRRRSLSSSWNAGSARQPPAERGKLESIVRSGWLPASADVRPRPRTDTVYSGGAAARPGGQ